MSAASCYRVEAGAIVLAVRLTPKGGRDQLDGIALLADGSAVALARVRAAPEDGAANRALIVLLARTFGAPKSAIELVSGATTRLKRVRIPGDPVALGAIVEAWPRK